MAATVILVCAVFSVFLGAVAQSNYLPDTQNVYHLFTRQNPTVSQPMLLGWSTLIGSNFSIQRRTVVIIHGWDSDPISPFNVAMVPAIMAAADVNLIAVDWSAGATESDYNVLISNNVPIGAESIARFIFWLNLETGATIDQYHIIGFEVGSHMGGLVGRSLNGLVPFVTALNPPRHGWNQTNMFAPTDGLITEAIHTDIFGTGMIEPVADMDFYPNGGLTQPGCHPFQWECSRDRAFQYFAESIVTGGFTASKCETELEILTGDCDNTNTLPMGGLSNKAGLFDSISKALSIVDDEKSVPNFTNSGLYFVATNMVPPYSMS